MSVDTSSPAVEESRILDFGKRADSGCPECGFVSMFSASLIHQSWMQSKDHLPATKCRCGGRYYSWSVKQNFECRKGK